MYTPWAVRVLLPPVPWCPRRHWCQGSQCHCGEDRMLAATSLGGSESPFKATRAGGSAAPTEPWRGLWAAGATQVCSAWQLRGLKVGMTSRPRSSPCAYSSASPETCRPPAPPHTCQIRICLLTTSPGPCWGVRSVASLGREQSLSVPTPRGLPALCGCLLLAPRGACPRLPAQGPQCADSCPVHP